MIKPEEKIFKTKKKRGNLLNIQVLVTKSLFFLLLRKNLIDFLRKINRNY